ncbi:hypothetical protein [Bacillus sp. T33-2]|uniref:hypothetical protein n=1 Tax=Bacillus sp. T33-2 TaxID=2054168 RepID=UPI00115A9B7F|nr:hypothetical protein [Bacillus sp. T33-2]
MESKIAVPALNIPAEITTDLQKLSEGVDFHVDKQILLAALFCFIGFLFIITRFFLRRTGGKQRH